MGIVNLTKGGLRCEIVQFTMLVLLSRERKAEHIVTEHDNPADWRRFARRSIEPIKALGLHGGCDLIENSPKYGPSIAQ
ncbi:hypothetical protein ELH97_30455 (plasmid) [Rhizobium leguminosarum]|uniref:hypothetical protein n=1 Tax=Rhizobium leguminosarum TaxID=384 RepID=UPI001030FE67|nr:hypothetical protein [Rhizobium leguminosarum]TAX27312.1 hypothetical protein ELI05_29440 [Rhizobium leguminosarum]TAX86166.1 hypothetical protein ELH97_30455 [Rhizobium leguminosarum]